MWPSLVYCVVCTLVMNCSKYTFRRSSILLHMCILYVYCMEASINQMVFLFNKFASLVYDDFIHIKQWIQLTDMNWWRRHSQHWCEIIRSGFCQFSVFHRALSSRPNVLYTNGCTICIYKCTISSSSTNFELFCFTDEWRNRDIHLPYFCQFITNCQMYVVATCTVKTFLWQSMINWQKITIFNILKWSNGKLCTLRLVVDDTYDVLRIDIKYIYKKKNQIHSDDWKCTCMCDSWDAKNFR